MQEYDGEADRRIVELARTAPEDALRQAHSLTDQFPLETRAWASLAYVQIRMGDYVNALLSAKQAEQLAPLEPANQFDLGRIYIRLQKFEEAKSHFTKGIELCIKQDFNYYLDACQLMRAFCFCKLGRFSEAESDLLHVEYESPIWIDKLRTKAELIEACRRRRLD